MAKTKDSAVAGATEAQTRVMPSQFMRQLRPEYYSDTSDRSSYVLDGPTLGFHLDTITDRNQTQDFELFCRKLCERAICPNLRPQTGPEGGGDSKVDSETYPVASEISQIYIGEPKAANERWAFAYSAKKTWADKVRKDVRGIVETGRKYDRIVCITSRPARSKDRARLEDELSKQYGLPITIHDRSWIAKEVLENDRKDLAYNYLGVGQETTIPLRLGPTDYTRTQQLADAEATLADPDAFKGIETQRVSEALIAAKLSRGLERPRTDTDGRFLRAIRLANDGGTFRQQLETRYEYLWTALWWYDDVALVNESYDELAELALHSESAKNLEFLCNLIQALCSAVIHGHLTRSDSKLDDRIATLIAALELQVANRDRPNNRLEAQTALLLLKMSVELLNSNRGGFSAIWKEFSNVLLEAQGLGEFDADRFAKLVDVTGAVAGNDPDYNQLVEDLAAFVSKRKSEGEGALILLKRAERLELSDHFDVIRLTGKAAMGLTKKEYSDSLVNALHLLTMAYRSAGLLWAARASCAFVAASLIIDGEEESEIPVLFIPTMKVFAWLALELRCVPDFLGAIQMLNGALHSLPLTDESQAKVRSDIQELEYAFACQILNLSDEQLGRLDQLPDILEGLGLVMARTALLFALGYRDLLRADGSFPEAETDAGVEQMLSLLMSQPVSESIGGDLVLNGGDPDTVSTSIVGMRLEIETLGTQESSLLAQAVVGALEAFFATAIDARVVPHTESMQIALHFSDTLDEPTFIINSMTMKGVLDWPSKLSLTSFGYQRSLQDLLVDVASKVLATAFIIEKPKEFFEQLFVAEAVMNRAAMVAVSANSHHRVFGRNLACLADWQRDGHRTYPAKARPSLSRVEFPPQEPEGASDATPGFPPKITDHRDMGIRSIIDVHAWDEASWRGTAYIQFDPHKPAAMAFMFENRDAALSIFQRWHERLGNEDKNEEIRVSILRNLPAQSKYHYTVLVTSNPKKADFDRQKTLVVASRSMTMEPSSDLNLERFLGSYHHFKAYFLMPAALNPKGEPEPIFELAILKRELSVKNASDVGEHDIERMGLRSHLASRRNPD